MTSAEVTRRHRAIMARQSGTYRPPSVAARRILQTREARGLVRAILDTLNRGNGPSETGE